MSAETDARAREMRRHFDLGNRGQAAAICQALLSADPSLAEPYLVAGLMARANGATAEAEPFLRRALDLGCRDPVGLVALADMLRERGDHGDALARYRECLAASPRHALALIGIVRTLRDMGQAAAARDMLSRTMLAGDALFKPAERTRLWLELAGLHLARDAIPEALRAFAIAHDRRPPAPGEVAVFSDGGDLAAWCRARGHRVHEVAELTLRRLKDGGAERPARLCYLPEARVIGDTSIPASADGAFFADGLIPNADKMAMADVSIYYDGLLAADGERILALAKRRARHSGDHLFLGFHENFGHWMVNVLTRLIFLRHLPELRRLPLVVGSAIGAKHRECLAALGYGEDDLVVLEAGVLHEFDGLWVPTMLYHGHAGQLYWSDRIFAFLRETFAVATAPAPRPGRRLFVGRAAARWRRLVNETELLAAVAGHGFEMIDPAKLSIAEQVRLAGSAEVIMGPFGAGMMLLLFAAPGTHIVELKYEVASMDVHPKIAEILGLDYHPVVGRAVADSGYPLNHDFIVDIDQVSELLASIVAR